MLNAQALKTRVEALGGAVSVLQSVGVSREHIEKLLSSDPALTKLLGEPVADLESAQVGGDLQKVFLANADRDSGGY